MKISMNVTTYTSIVNRIEANSQDLLGLNDQGGYVEPDADCLLNVVVPDYKAAYENLIDIIRFFKTTNTSVVKLMNTVKDNYVKSVDQKWSDTLNENSEYGVIQPGSVGESDR